MHHQWSRYAKRFRDDLHDIEQLLTMIPTRGFESESNPHNALRSSGTSLTSRNRSVRFAARNRLKADAAPCQKCADNVAKVVLQEMSKFLRAAGALFV